MSFGTWNAPPAWKTAPVIIDGVVTVAEARKQLGLRTTWAVSLRALAGLLEACWNSDDKRCITQASIDEELSWWLEASPSERWKRHGSLFFMILANG